LQFGLFSEQVGDSCAHLLHVVGLAMRREGGVVCEGLVPYEGGRIVLGVVQDVGQAAGLCSADPGLALIFAINVNDIAFSLAKVNRAAPCAGDSPATPILLASPS
jgi:hypothetical protein